MNWPWSVLGLPGPSDLPAIRRAYAARLKTTHPEEDPEGFQQLHSAFQSASRIARRQKHLDCQPAESGEAPQAEHGPDGGGDGGAEETPAFAEWVAAWNPPLPPKPEPDPACDTPLDGGEAPPQIEQDWDYDRLFAEGDAERAASRRLSPEWPDTAFSKREAQAWRDAEAALHAVENFYFMELPLHEWKRFFRGTLFCRVKDNPDFIFGLEDFISRTPAFPKAVKVALFLALGLENGVKNPLHRPLYHQLVDSYHALYTPFGNGHGPVHIKEILYRMVHRPGRGKRKLRIPVVVAIVAAVWIGVGVLSWLNALRANQPEQQWDQICAYLEEDFGHPFHYRYDLEERGYSGLFSPVNAKLLFQGAIHGKRNLENGARGYTTNYPAVLLRQELENFGRQWSFSLTFNCREGADLLPGEAPDAYYFSVPILGAGEGIEALGNLLEALEQQDWYAAMPPEFRIVFYHGSMTIWDYDTDQIDVFDGAKVRAQYENQFCYRYAAFLVEESGAPERDIGAGYLLLERGIVQVQGEPYLWLDGLDRDRTERMQYYVRAKEDQAVWAIYCVPLPGEHTDDFSGYLPSTINRLESGDWVNCYRPRSSYLK